MIEFRTSNALRHVVASHLEMDASRDGAHLFVYIKETLDLLLDIVITAGLVAIYGFGVSVDRV